MSCIVKCMRWITCIGCALLIMGSMVGTPKTLRGKRLSPVDPGSSRTVTNPLTGMDDSSPLESWVILAVGGSVAKGWNAMNNDGYLSIALADLSTQLNRKVKFWNDSIGGYTPLKFNPLFAKLLKAHHPNIVIISWGMLDEKDAKREEQYAKCEITAARTVTSAHVHVFDLLNNMKRWLKSHHLSVNAYASNAWHPNTAGHALAGQLLDTLLLKRKSSLGI